jgi:hypothetical protein
VIAPLLLIHGGDGTGHAPNPRCARFERGVLFYTL